MDKRALIDLCLKMPGVYEDYPFRLSEWAAIRHSGNKKSMAFVYEREGCLCVNLKCEPMKADFLRSIYQGVAPGYHLNHQHWNTVLLGKDVPHSELLSMIQDSYDLTRPKQKGRTSAKEQTKTK